MDENRSDSVDEGELARASAFGWDVFFWAGCIMCVVFAGFALRAPSVAHGVVLGVLGVLAGVCGVVAVVAKGKRARWPKGR